ncbi:phosphodiester glycosidase family protein [Amycolatopsis methanolica]|uniref:phosphodiester glycosidase family protein n=1 Tax=Amycolatopsis methanolica TaxID=1814 RepID=UPI003416ADC1
MLLGRERGAAELAGLRVGDRVLVTDRLVARGVPPFEFAVGGFPILDDGAALPGLDASLAPRTAAGASADGRTLYLLAVDGRSAASTGMGVGEVAALLASLGASEAVNLDGGGSTTLVTAGRGAPRRCATPPRTAPNARSPTGSACSCVSRRGTTPTTSSSAAAR